ncbi:MAG TPA: YezD family protein [Verrucomicrobiae bacterium]|jgi:hypothetical protein
MVTADNATESTWIKLVQEQVGKLRFGLVQIVVHEGKVVQVDCTSRVRLDQPPTARNSKAHWTTSSIDKPKSQN